MFNKMLIQRMNYGTSKTDSSHKIGLDSFSISDHTLSIQSDIFVKTSRGVLMVMFLIRLDEKRLNLEVVLSFLVKRKMNHINHLFLYRNL